MKPFPPVTPELQLVLQAAFFFFFIRIKVKAKCEGAARASSGRPGLHDRAGAVVLGIVLEEGRSTGRSRGGGLRNADRCLPVLH